MRCHSFDFVRHNKRPFELAHSLGSNFSSIFIFRDWNLMRFSFLFPFNCFHFAIFNRWNGDAHPVIMRTMFAKMYVMCYIYVGPTQLAYICPLSLCNRCKRMFSVLFAWKTVIWATHNKICMFHIPWTRILPFEFIYLLFSLALSPSLSAQHIYDDFIFTRRICLTLTHLTFTHFYAYIHWQR